MALCLCMCDLIDLTAVQKRVQKGFSALMVAALRNHVECAQLLLDVGSDKNAKNVVRLSVSLDFGWVFLCF